MGVVLRGRKYTWKERLKSVEKWRRLKVGFKEFGLCPLGKVE